jgi:hypothetical protein
MARFKGSDAARNAAQAVQINEKEAEIADLWNNLTDAKSTQEKSKQYQAHVMCDVGHKSRQKEKKGISGVINKKAWKVS